MIIRVLLAALAAGLLAGILMTPLQYTKVIPIIQQAETFEGGPSRAACLGKSEVLGKSDIALTDPDRVQACLDHAEDLLKARGTQTDTHDHGAAAAQADHTHENHAGHSEGHDHGSHETAEPRETKSRTLVVEVQTDTKSSFGRVWNTILANLVTGAGFALLMAGVSMAAGVNVTFATGLVWGVLGWLSVQFLPSLGLPPALPGFPHADLSERQVWWVATVGLSIIGFWLLLLTKSQATRAVGMVALLVSHLYGAPQPADISSAVPAYLAAQYVVATLATTLFFWVALGLALGFFMDRMKIEEQ
ncbi:MAG: CbtA family protein [Rhizobiaceae bacterium]